MKQTKSRLTVDLTPEAALRLARNLEWGEQGNIFRKIVDQFNTFVEKYGKVGVAMFMCDKLSLLDILSLKEKEQEGGPQRPTPQHPRDAAGGGAQPHPQGKSKPARK